MYHLVSVSTRQKKFKIFFIHAKFNSRRFILFDAFSMSLSSTAIPRHHTNLPESLLCCYWSNWPLYREARWLSRLVILSYSTSLEAFPLCTCKVSGLHKSDKTARDFSLGDHTRNGNKYTFSWFSSKHGLLIKQGWFSFLTVYNMRD